MIDIDLIYDVDCPHASRARANLRRALESQNWPVRWREWLRTASETPAGLRRLGSPTILVDGRDVAGAAPLDGEGACRIYLAGNRQRVDAPSVPMIVTALQETRSKGSPPVAKARLLSSLAVVPGTIAAFLPALSCPACWPAYAGLLSSLGIGFMWNGKYLLPITVLLLGVALAALAHRARERKGYGPLVVGSIGSVALLVAKFLVHRPWVAGAAAGLILFASVWNAWPQRIAPRSCTACTPDRSHGLSTKGEVR